MGLGVPAQKVSPCDLTRPSGGLPSAAFQREKGEQTQVRRHRKPPPSGSITARSLKAKARNAVLSGVVGLSCAEGDGLRGSLAWHCAHGQVDPFHAGAGQGVFLVEPPRRLALRGLHALPTFTSTRPSGNACSAASVAASDTAPPPMSRRCQSWTPCSTAFLA